MKRQRRRVWLCMHERGGQAGLQKMLETEGSTWGSHAEQKDAVNLSCVSNEDKTSVCY